ncbi:MAG: hypothetical protein ACD_73C00464G0001 [uncultured bacterium]|nr:MAG: hypothetical protein ACD_73C00464G0001 [uncultured bacterium]
MGESGLLTSILGKPQVHLQGRETFFSGIHIMNESLLDAQINQTKFCIIREIYIPLLEKAEKLGGYLHKGYWNDLGTLERLSQTEAQITQMSFTFQKEIEEFKKILIPH